MSESTVPNTQNLITVFKYPFTDPRWFQKMLVGALLVLASMIIWVIPSVFVTGYLSRISRRIISGDGQAALPEWDDWGKLFVDGIKLVGVSIIYSIPLLISILATYAMMFIPYIGMLSSMSDWSGHGMNNGFPSSFFLIFLMYPMMGVGILISLVTAVFLPPALMHVIARDSFSAGFHFSDWWKVFRANLGGFMIANLITLANLTVLYLVTYILMMTIILGCLSPLVTIATSIYLGALTFTLYAQAYRTGQDKLTVMSSMIKTRNVEPSKKKTSDGATITKRKPRTTKE
ncbi:MAG: DUF4013 domain-containing protein [Anaerolineaceae bacterium]